MSDRLEEIKREIAEGNNVPLNDTEWLISEVERLRERCREARGYVTCVADTDYFSPALSHGAYEWLAGEP